MPSSTYFVQECPTCGRKLQVRVEYLGKRVVCQHCGSKFHACDRQEDVSPGAALSLLDRADELIRQSGINLARHAAGSNASPTG